MIDGLHKAASLLLVRKEYKTYVHTVEQHNVSSAYEIQSMIQKANVKKILSKRSCIMVLWDVLMQPTGADAEFRLFRV